MSYNDQVSDLLSIKSGVPQGSILGPLLFIIYMNDINNVSSFFTVISFADDTTLTISICKKNLKSLKNGDNSINEEMINHELNLIYEWMCLNKLAMNMSKTKYILFSLKKSNFQINLNIEGVNLDRVEEVDYLGIRIHENVKWGPHIDRISSKIRRITAAMKKMSKILPQ